MEIRANVMPDIILKSKASSATKDKDQIPVPVCLTTKVV